MMKHFSSLKKNKKSYTLLKELSLVEIKINDLRAIIVIKLSTLSPIAMRLMIEM